MIKSLFLHVSIMYLSFSFPIGSFQILDLLSQAVQQFGKAYVQTFINLNNVKQKMHAIQNLISEEI